MGSSAATKYQLDLAGGRQHEPDGVPGSMVRGALFADLTDDEQDELLELPRVVPRAAALKPSRRRGELR